ncbi:MAG: AzlD domain-containing protein [Christensenellaceae bacterium]|nr:AzlD domain-containing protein [Christensenellaceae bacterium]
MSEMTRSVLIVAVVALVTVLIRFLPFIIFKKGRETPPFVTYLGKVLPYAIMGMLVVFCLKNISFIDAPHGLPELIACAIVAGLHLWKRNTLISIVGGTACYMLMIRFIF